MPASALLVVAATVFFWGAVAARLERADLTAPIVFVAVGALLAVGGLVDVRAAPEGLKPLVEITLVWVLFADAARVGIRDLRADAVRIVRLLALGLPLTVLAGWLLAVWLFPGAGPWVALLIAAALAPTDAALGVAVVTNPVVPSRVRRLINVESGLNDGIVTPVVLFALAGAAATEGLVSAPGAVAALVELLLGAGVGVAVGEGGGGLLRLARRRAWAVEDFAGPAVLALALAAYLTALTVHGNGFVAAFCGGLAFGATTGRRGRAELVFTEQAAALVSLLVWLAFGAIVVPVMAERLDWAVVLYAALSLTVVRMVPVALASLGSGLDGATVAFIGWFGPRGLASLVFALLALEELGDAADGAVTVVAVTVFLSVIAHGVTAAPLAARYGRARAVEAQPAPELPVRGLPRRGRPRPAAAGGRDEPR